MIRPVHALFTTLGLCLLSAASPSPVAAQRDARPRVPDHVRSAAAQGRPVRVIVGVRMGYRAEGRMDAAAVAEQRAAIRNRSQQLLDRLPAHISARARRFRMIPFFTAAVDADTLAVLDADADVVSIEEDTLAAPTLSESGPLIGAPAAWAAGYSGAGWTVAILDMGVDKTHPFLGGKVVSEACYSNAGGSGDGTSLCPGGVNASTALDSGVNCGFSGCEHGTHVAGIAAGRGSDISGIAKDASLVSIQVFTRFDSTATCGALAPCLLSYTSDEILALERVFALRGTFNIASVNLSLGGDRYVDQASCDADNVSIKAAIDNLRSVGIATVIAGGNGGHPDSLTAPGCISSAVSVGATTKTDRLASFSDTASFLSLLAPGSSITSSVPGGGFAARSGTSMATPHVAGAWAVLKQRRPAASVSQILSALKSNGVSVTDPQSGQSFPRIRVDAAIAALPVPQLFLDAPLNGATLTEPFVVAGWALDPSAGSGTGVDAIHVYAYPATGSPIFLGAAAYGGARADVGAIFGARFTNSGFGLTAQGLAAGVYQLVAYAHSSVSGRFDAAQAITVTMAPPVSSPRIFVDTPAGGATVGPSFLIAGWALDGGSPSGPGIDAVHIYAYPNPGSGTAPIFLGVASDGGARGDVGAAFGSRFTNSGYGLVAGGLAPGSYRLVVYARSTVSGLFSAGTRDVTVRAPGDPAMSIDRPVNGATLTQPFAITGWAIDRDSTAGPGVDALHVWAYPAGGGAPIFLGVATGGGSRGDIGGIFGSRFTSSGYGLTVSALSPGTYDLVVYLHSTASGTFNRATVVRVNVR